MYLVRSRSKSVLIKITPHTGRLNPNPISPLHIEMANNQVIGRIANRTGKRGLTAGNLNQYGSQ
jgi:hypothetical protein